MSGRIKNDVSASFMRGRFVIPLVVALLVIAAAVWLFR